MFPLGSYEQCVGQILHAVARQGNVFQREELGGMVWLDIFNRSIKLGNASNGGGCDGEAEAFTEKSHAWGEAVTRHLHRSSVWYFKR